MKDDSNHDRNEQCVCACVCVWGGGGGAIQLPRVIEGGVGINNLKPPGPLPQYYLPTMVTGWGGSGISDVSMEQLSLS